MQLHPRPLKSLALQSLALCLQTHLAHYLATLDDDAARTAADAIAAPAAVGAIAAPAGVYGAGLGYGLGLAAPAGIIADGAAVVAAEH